MNRITRRHRARNIRNTPINTLNNSSRPYINSMFQNNENSPRRQSLNRSINFKNQKEIREQKLPHYYDEDVIKEINKINKSLIKKGKGYEEYQIVVDYYDKIDKEIHHYYGNNSGFSNERILFVCLFHNDTCVSSIFFERVRKNDKETIEINVATHNTYQKMGINTFLTAVAIRVIYLGFKYKEIYSSAINTISAWIIIKDYFASTINLDTLEPEMSEDEVKITFPNMESIQEYYKTKSLKLKISIKKNAKKALEIEERLFKI